MQFTEAQRAIFLAKLQGLWKDPKCDVCSSNTWLYADRLFELREYNRGSFVIGSPLIPVVAAICATCGHTKLFSAIALGIVNPATGEVVDG
jgi:hypothetical protein